ncbi:MAG: hypothetical protein IT532_01295 [Burkholderiales bacterium]|nr:hypothetical protein [Burkholderiales bacterium]
MGWTDRGKAAYVAALIVLGLAAGSAEAVTNCGKARKTNVEMLLCSNEKVARADNLMALAFRDAFHRTDDPEALLADQQRWTTEVRDACKDVPCLMRAFEDRASELDTWRPPR